ncbi:hypothetical protein NL64_06375 [Pseudomonas fluorescens]|uniref:DUF7740 domain-containing protein n=1 Tax=Pseudomonas fluorescens TaxID=294 RepID=UPI00054C6931|nr:hypothetical protein [Pseudomonas fluorescens]KII34882.1 hypothetical protein NL64_06375 [Pseudomonas fluorescens]
MAKAHKKRIYDLTDVLLVMSLAARIHQSNAAVRKSAISMYPNANQRARIALVLVRDSQHPINVLDLFLKELTDE